MLIEELLREFSHEAYVRKVRHSKGYKTLTLLIERVPFEQVTKRLARIVDKVSIKGEKISCEVFKGDIKDMGVKTLEIPRGKFIELYDYEKLCIYFIRAYEFKRDKRKWIAIYVDENSETPWWDEKEREKLFKKKEEEKLY